MSPSKLVWFSTVGAAALFLGVWSWQRERIRITQGELAAERERVSDGANLRSQHERLTASQVTELELASLRADHEAVRRLRGEIDALKKRSEAPPVEPSGGGAVGAIDLPVQNWKNAGRATPAAALETWLWAGMGGDLKAMATTLAWEGGAQEKARALFSRLPEAERIRFGSPEKLVAALAAKELPHALTVGLAVVDAGSARVVLYGQRGVGSRILLKEIEIALRQYPDGWRLVVPESAVDNYAAGLSGQGNKSR